MTKKKDPGTYSRTPSKIVQAELLAIIKKGPITRKQLAELTGYTLIKVTRCVAPLLEKEGETNQVYVARNEYFGSGGRSEQVLAYGPGKMHAISQRERERIASLANNTFRSAAKLADGRPAREIIYTSTGLIHRNNR